MGLFSSSCGSVLRTLSQAAAKAAAAKFRRAGLLPVHSDWATRAEMCERCPLRVIRAGLSYCGKPLLAQIEREPLDGCGCPTHAKAKSPDEHCPLDRSHQPAETTDTSCNCKWCSIHPRAN